MYHWIMLAIVFGSIIGGITTRLYLGGKLIGTIHIEDDRLNGGENYRFNFNDFSEIRDSKIVRLKIEDHTTRQ